MFEVLINEISKFFYVLKLGIYWEFGSDDGLKVVVFKIY